MANWYQWNDDDRKNDYISYYNRKEEEYVPVYKILKEMYDEDKANLYIYDTEEEYQYKYGQFCFTKYCEYYSEYYSEYNSIYYDNHKVSNVDIDTYDEDVVVQNNNTIESEIEKNNDNEEQQVECINKSKFIYT